MDLYISVMFWMGVFVVVVRLLSIPNVKYPRITTHSIGEDMLGAVISLVLLIWVGLLYFGFIS